MRPSSSAPSRAPRLVLALALGLAAPARAQPTEAPPSFFVQQVELAENRELFSHGKAAIFHGEVGVQGHGFALAGLSMLQPVAVTLLADPSAPVTMTIGKDWTFAERTATTDAAGHATELLRTDDLAQIHVFAQDAAQRRSYDLVIWVGDERTDYPDMPSAIDFDRPEEAKRDPGRPVGGGEASPPASSALPAAPAPASPQTPEPRSTELVLWVIAALLAALVVLASVALFRRRKP